MFVDFKDQWPPPPPWEPERRRRRLRRRDERVMLWLVGATMFALFLAPIGGATLIGAVVALLRG